MCYFIAHSLFTVKLDKPLTIKLGIVYRKSAKVRVKNVHFLNVRVKKYSRSQDSYVLQCILLKTFVRLMFAVLAIRELFLTVNFCRFTVCPKLHGDLSSEYYVFFMLYIVHTNYINMHTFKLYKGSLNLEITL